MSLRLGSCDPKLSSGSRAWACYWAYLESGAHLGPLSQSRHPGSKASQEYHPLVMGAQIVVFPAMITSPKWLDFTDTFSLRMTASQSWWMAEELIAA